VVARKILTKNRIGVLMVIYLWVLELEKLCFGIKTKKVKMVIN
jgi:hypothetical protein